MKSYQEFIASKSAVAPSVGVEPGPINPKLFDFQKDIVRWALKRGRAAIFADCGLGKSFMQLEWARQIDGPVLIFCPLAVAQQTIKEGVKLGIKVTRAHEQSECPDGISITNYDRLDKFDLSKFDGIVLDESSILKSIDGATRTALIERCSKVPYRLCCTATPAPNDHMELGNHSEFLGIMDQTEMLAMYFTHDGGDTAKWRLKRHGEDHFWKWVCSWSVMLRRPSDLGYKDNGFELPPLNLHEHIVRQTTPSTDMLIPLPASSMSERLSARRDSIDDRCAEVARIINGSKEPWVVWCNLNAESAKAAALIADAVEVVGSDKVEVKEERMVGFSNGTVRIMVSKPSIAGFGMNWQHCSNVVFLGLSDSYEAYYQAVRRCWRFGQKKPVNVHIVIADTEGAVLQNIRRKEADAVKLAEGMVKHMAHISAGIIHGEAKRESSEYRRRQETGDGWRMELGDCVDVMNEMGDNSLHYSIYSPPFASLYTYSNSERDMGNSKDHGEFFEHYKFFVEQLFRVTMPGRNTSFHCMNLPMSKTREGEIGIHDFRGQLIRMYQDAGWIYHSEVCIWKDPVTAMQRTKALGLLHKQIKKDSCMSRMGIPDYVVTMRKPGDNPERVGHTDSSFPVDLWQKYASPVWDDINPSDTLQKESARENNDERHICPLQLEVIKRCLVLWSNPGDTVLSPFAGIGSEGYEAIKSGRKFVGIELKESYFNCAVNNLRAAERELKSEMLL